MSSDHFKIEQENIVTEKRFLRNQAIIIPAGR